MHESSPKSDLGYLKSISKVIRHIIPLIISGHIICTLSIT